MFINKLVFFFFSELIPFYCWSVSIGFTDLSVVDL